MAIGAYFGRMVGILVKALYRCVPAYCVDCMDMITDYCNIPERILNLGYSLSVNLMSHVSRLVHTRFLVPLRP